MLTKTVTICLLLVGIINFLPVMGLFSAERMSALYGISIHDSNLAILMKHRALLFGLIGGFILIAAFVPALQLSAFILSFLSMAGFILIAWTTGDYNPLIRKVLWVDAVALVAWAIGFGAFLKQT